jgi:hypothetical protein
MLTSSSTGAIVASRLVNTVATLAAHRSSNEF